MSINLGNVTKQIKPEELEFFEEEYIDWLEESQQIINMLNAIEIAEKAKASQSVECIAFAEELLGCSCEVVLYGDSKKVANAAINNFNTAIHMADRLLKRFNAFSAFIDEWDGSRKVIVDVPMSLITFGRDEPSVRGLANRKQTKQSQMAEIDDAIEVGSDALHGIKQVLKDIVSHKQTVRYAAKDRESASHQAGESVTELYKSVRNGVSVVLSDARLLINRINLKLKSHRINLRQIETAHIAEQRRNAKVGQRSIRL